MPCEQGWVKTQDQYSQQIRQIEPVLSSRLNEKQASLFCEYHRDIKSLRPKLY